MKLGILVALVATLSITTAQASVFKQVRKLSNERLQDLNVAGHALSNAYVGSYAVVEKTAARGRTAEELRLATIKESMHRYMCSFFDESIDLSLASHDKAGYEKTLGVFSQDFSNADEDAKVRDFKHALVPVIKDRSLAVYYGNASGNNTMGEIMGVYDRANDEVFYFGYTNCGSDD